MGVSSTTTGAGDVMCLAKKLDDVGIWFRTPMAMFAAFNHIHMGYGLMLVVRNGLLAMIISGY